MSDGVLPALLVLPVEREQVHDPLVDLVQGQHLAAGLLDGHGDQGDVRVRRLGVRVLVRYGLGSLARRPPQAGPYTGLITGMLPYGGGLMELMFGGSAAPSPVIPAPGL